jgi:glutamate-5-semialdehyde dehydrogenase
MKFDSVIQRGSRGAKWITGYNRAMDPLDELVQLLCERAKSAARLLGASPAAQRTGAVERFAKLLRLHSGDVLAANSADLEDARTAGLPPPMLERLRLDPARMEKLASAVEGIARQPDPVGELLETTVDRRDLRVDRVRVPLGVVLFMYESRPNVTADAAALCLRSGNAVILRGGKEAARSNRVLGELACRAVEEAGLPPAAVQIVPSSDRAIVPKLLKRSDSIDVVIPRGGPGLIRAVVSEARIPVLKHFTGNCHIFVDASSRQRPQEVVEIIVNAKTSYPGGGVCNAVEHVLFLREAADLIEPVCHALVRAGVEIRGDEAVRRHYPAAVPATESDWSEEYLSLVIGLKVVDSIDEAIHHINRYGSRHTDAILSLDEASIRRFVAEVDSGSVMVNASTRFADGGEYGLGAELGISTDKLHARGPMGARDLTTYKWVVRGNWVGRA